jgi:hypothetical protein
LTDFIKRGDAITQAKSHQAAMSGLMTEHVNLYGLRPKTLWGDDEVLLSKLPHRVNRRVISVATNMLFHHHRFPSHIIALSRAPSRLALSPQRERHHEKTDQEQQDERVVVSYELEQS